MLSRWRRIDYALAQSNVISYEDEERLFSELNINEYERRILDPEMPPANSSVLVCHPKTIMLGLETLGIIICDDFSVYIEQPADEFSPVPELLRRLHDRSKFQAYTMRHHVNDVYVLDAILDVYLTTLAYSVGECRESAEDLLRRVGRSFSTETCNKLQSTKLRLSRLNIDADGMASMIGRALDDDKASRLMVTLKVYYMKYNKQIMLIRQTLDDIASAETASRLNADQQRNQILRFELITLIVTLGLAIVSACSGVFGQNLSNASLTTVKYSFGVATGIYCVFAAALVWLCLWYFRRKAVL